MVNQELVSYVRSQIAQGVVPTKIRSLLALKGWKEEDIDQAFEVANSEVVPVSNTSQSQVSDPLIATTTITEDVNKPKGLPKLVILLLILLVVVIATLGGGYYYYFAPQQVLGRMVGKLSEVKTAKFDGKMTFSTSNSPSADNPDTSTFGGYFPTSYSIIFSGETDVNSLDNPRSKYKLKIDTFPVTLAEIEIRNFGTVYFINVLKLQDFGGLFDAKAFTNNWIKIDMEELQRTFGGDLGYTQTLTESQQEELLEFIFTNNPLVLGEKMGEEDLNGKKVMHYGFDLNKDNVVKIFEKAYALTYQDQKLEAADLEDFRQTLDSISFTNGNLWIGKWDSYLYKAAFNIDSIDQSATQNMSIGFEVYMSDFGAPVLVEEPLDFETIQELMEQYMQTFLPSVTNDGAMPSELQNSDLPEDFDIDFGEISSSFYPLILPRGVPAAVAGETTEAGN